MFIYDRVVKTGLSRSASPVDFAGLVPASVLSVGSVVSVLALEVNKREEEEHERAWLFKLDQQHFSCVYI